MDAAIWIETRERLRARRLWGEGASLSLRWPSGGAMWFGCDEAAPRRLAVSAAAEAPIDAAVYAARPDVGAVAVGGGDFARALAASGGGLPILFDEQARHLGATAAPRDGAKGLAAALRRGGNVGLVGGTPMCLGATPRRLALNAELFEKCAEAYVLAFAAGGPTPALPRWVRWIANRRLLKDERRAAHRFAQGLPPEDNNRY